MEKVTNTRNSVLVHKHKGLFATTVFKLSSGEVTVYESWVDHVSWKKMTCHEEKERADTDIEFSFCILLLIYCPYSLVSFSLVSVGWETLFRSPPQNGSRNIRLSSHCLGLCSPSSVAFRIRLIISSQKWDIPLLPPSGGGRTYPFSLVLHLLRIFGTSVFFFKSFLINIVIHPLLTDLQPVLWPDSP